MHDDVMNLRRDLLKLLKLSEYSEMTTTNLSSLTSFVVPQLVCSNCNHYRDIDLYREINSTHKVFGFLVVAQFNRAR